MSNLLEKLPRYPQTVIDLFDELGIPLISTPINDLTQIGKGGNSIIYRGTMNDQEVSLKTIHVFMDNVNIFMGVPINKINANIDEIKKCDIVTQTGINDIVISHFISQTRDLQSLGLPTVQKIYGYTKPTESNDNTIQTFGLVKEYYECDLKQFIKSSEFTKLSDKNRQELLSNLVLHILLTIKLVFIDHFKGRYSDASLQNILIQRTDLQYVQYGDKKIKVVGGILPVLCDFGASRIVVNDRIFMRTNWKNNYDTMRMFNCFKLDTLNNTNDCSYDFFVFFNDLRKNLNLRIKEPVMKGFDYLIKKRENYNISWNKYRPNCVTIEDIFRINSVKEVLSNNEFVE